MSDAAAGADPVGDAVLRRMRLSVRAAAMAAVGGLGAAGVLPLSVAGGLVATTLLLSVLAAHRSAGSDRLTQALVLMAMLAIGTTAMVRSSRVGSPQLLASVVAPQTAALLAVHAVMWRTRRDLSAGAVLAAAVLVTGCAVAPSPAEIVALALAWPCLLLAHRYGRELALCEGRPVAVVGGGRRPALAARGVALAIVASLALFLVLPGVGSFPLRSFGTGTAGAIARPPGGFGAGRLDLRARGQLPTYPVLAVASDTPALWRGAVFGTYDGTGFTTAVIGQRLPGWNPSTGSARWALPGVTGRVSSARVVRLDPSDDTVYAPGRVVGVVAPYGVVHVIGDTAVRLDPYPRAPAAYRVSWQPPPAPARLARAGSADKPVGADSVDPRWLQLPAELPARVGALARTITRGATTRYAAVTAIEHWLRTHATYRLDSPVPGPGEDAVDDFLFRDRTGFCEQFAAAETVLLRTLGIPARLVTGYAYGSKEGGVRVFRASDAHAWVEVYYPGAGWAPSDPTAGAPLATGSASSSPLGALLQRLGRLVTSLPGGRPALAVLLLLLTVGGLAAWWPVRTRAARLLSRLAARLPARLTRGRRSGRRQGREPSPATAAYERLQTRLRQVGAHRQPAETLTDLHARLAAGFGSGPATAAAFEVLEQEWYGAAPPDPDAVRLAAAALDAVAPLDAVPSRGAAVPSRGTAVPSVASEDLRVR